MAAEATPRTQTPENAVLYGKLDSVKPLIDALECIRSPTQKSTDVTITQHSQGGMQFTAEEPGVLLASVIVPRTAFTQFSCRGGELRVRLNLSLLLDCLSIVGSQAGERHAASAAVWYAGEGHPLMVRLFDGDADTVCELSTLQTEEGETDFEVDAHGIANSAIVGCDALRDALCELEYGGATAGELRMAPGRPRFRVSSRGGAAGCEVVLPDPTDGNTFQSFESGRMQAGVYRLKHLLRCVKALGMSESCKVCMNGMGTLSMMCRMKEEGGRERCFVEFIVVAQEIEDEESGDG